ncbi:MAG: BsuPI-related putative proteinase inhibitor [Bacillus sp. (in: Bacteria)]|nr:BsuPI-related putative proteinase inhibitor [Bacillus sp. (in: firmicutes)]
MKKLLILLLMGIVLAGCGTGNGQGNEEITSGSGGSGDNGEPADGGDSGGEATGELEPSISLAGDLVFQYKVRNDSEESVTMEFSSSQRYDFAVETDAGETVFLFSSVAMFLQVEGEEVLQPGDELVFDLDLKEYQVDAELEPGDYVLRAWMTPKDGSMFEVSMEFTVE